MGLVHVIGRPVSGLGLQIIHFHGRRFDVDYVTLPFSLKTEPVPGDSHKQAEPFPVTRMTENCVIRIFRKRIIGADTVTALNVVQYFRSFDHIVFLSESQKFPERRVLTQFQALASDKINNADVRYPMQDCSRQARMDRVK